MKIVFWGVSETERLYFKKVLNGEDISFFTERLDEESAVKSKDAEVICVFVNSVVSKEVIDAMPHLKYIATRSTGFDHIDCEYARSKGIQISNVPAYGSHTVAEFAFGLILNLSRNISKANAHLRESTDFNYFSMMQGFDLLDKTLGIIGTGKIGKNVARIAKGFGMKIIAYDLHPDQAFAGEVNVSYKSLPELLSMSDIITLHTPYTKENHHMINKESISLMKRGVCLVNTARGELVDTDALIWGLKEGIIAGAGLDVLEGEKELKEEMEILGGERSEHVKDYKTLLEDHMLMEMPNVIITPHMAFYTREAVDTILKVSANNVQGFISGAVINLVK